jgi:hypothetical protein
MIIKEPSKASIMWLDIINFECELWQRERERKKPLSSDWIRLVRTRNKWLSWAIPACEFITHYPANSQEDYMESAKLSQILGQGKTMDSGNGKCSTATSGASADFSSLGRGGRGG